MSWDLSRWKPSTTQSVLAGFLSVGFLLRLYAAHFPNLIHPDAIFQTLEPAHRLAYGYGVITWEWREGIRNWVFPAFLAAIMKATAWLAPGSSGYLWGIRAVLSLLSLVTIWFGYAWAKRTSGIEAAIIAAGLCAIWYDLVIFAPSALTEVVSTHLLLPGLYFGIYGDRLPEHKRLFLAGLLCGLAVSLRLQLAPAVGFALLYFCHPKWRQRTLPLTAGVLLPVITFGIVDAFTWSYPFQSLLKNFWINAVQDQSAAYGTQPWYWYLLVLAEQMFPLFALALFGVRKSPLLGWIALIILVSHSVIGHKEVRFIYPVMPIVATLAAIGFAEVIILLKGSLPSTPSARGTLIASALAFFALLSYRLAPYFPYRRKDTLGIAALNHLSRDHGACGLALYRMSWYNTGGYTLLHKDIPILIISNKRVLRAQRRSYNFILAKQSGLHSLRGFKPTDCRNGLCLYRRRGNCSAPLPMYEINTVLRDTHQ